MSSSSPKKIILRSSDGESFEVEEAVALESQTIKHMIEDDCADSGIPLPNVNSKILAKVIEYCKKHVDSSKGGEDKSSSSSLDEELKSWDADFVKVDQATLFDLILAANYLNIKGLLDLTCQTVADMIKGKSPEEIRKTFNIRNDFTPEEEEETMSLSLTLRKIFVLRLSDGGVPFEVEEAVALLSETIRDGIEDNWMEGGLPFPTIDSKILSLVSDYYKKHFHTSSSHLYLDEELMSWETDFVKLEKDTLFDLIRAAIYLNIKGLLDLTCRQLLGLVDSTFHMVADMIKGYISPRRFARPSTSKSNFTPEE
ncbi:hypothetical protein MLD38_024826 [Melastoma candidum]|uniref:Uncharacterized protein n=1 Tax=Melastoma candidum TaxID=119954 RepID=A0ACB9NT85_9MYRT|nr:hypothetical protein MLD38_024826 [Melastoma candidum]